MTPDQPQTQDPDPQPLSKELLVKAPGPVIFDYKSRLVQISPIEYWETTKEKEHVPNKL